MSVKIYVVSRGRFANGNFGWERSRETAFEFQEYYGGNGALDALDMAIRHAEQIRREPSCRGNQDAHALRYFDD